MNYRYVKHCQHFEYDPACHNRNVDISLLFSRRLCCFSLVTEVLCNLLNHCVISLDSLKMRGLQP